MAEGNEKVSFTKASAQRIADAVRGFESGNRDGAPFISSPRDVGGVGRSVKMGTFVGSWDIGATKTVTLCGSGRTAEVKNLTVHIMEGAAGEQTVLFSKVCGTNVAVELPLDQCKNIGGAINKIAGFSSGKVQVLGHDASNCLLWYDIATCSTTS